MIRRLSVCVALSVASGGFILSALQVPAEAGDLQVGTAGEREELGRRLVAAGPAGVRELVGGLVDAGTGDDTRARMALHALAYHVSRPGAEADRRMLAGVLASELEGDLSPALKGFLVRVLRLVGGKECIEILGHLLLAGGVGDAPGADVALSEHAAQSLVTIARSRPPSRRQVTAQFRNALPRAKGPNRPTIIQALGVLRDRESVGELLKAARDPDRETRLAALWGLGNIGDPSAAPTLLEAASVQPRYERAKATAACLLLAERLAARDRVRELALSLDLLARRMRRRRAAAERLPESLAALRQLSATTADAGVLLASRFVGPSGLAEAERIYRELWETRTDPLDRHVRCAALQGLVNVLGGRAFDQLRSAMRSEDIEIRAVATEAAVTTPGRGLTLKWIEELKTGAPEARAGTLRILGRRGDHVALPAVLEAMRGRDQDAQLAAIDAVAALGGVEAIAPLVKILGSPEEGERKAAQLALQRIAGAEVTRAIASSIADASSRAKCALLEVLAARGARAHLDDVFRCTKDADRSVRIAALGALGTLATEESLPSLIDLLVKTESSKERQAAEKSVSTVCARIENKDDCVGPLLAPLGRASVQAKCSLLRALGRVGGARALEAVRSATRDAPLDLKDAAVRTLAEWPDAEAARDLLSIARGSRNMAHRVIALRGYVRVVGLPTGRPAAETLSMYKQAMRAARRPEEKKLVLAGLAGVGHLEALAMVERYTREATYREEAAAAAVKIARAVGGEHREKAMAALAKVMRLSKSDAVRKQAREAVDHIERFEDCVTSWMISGPYTKRGKGGQALFKVPFAPEEPGGQAKWQLWTGRGDRPWFVDLMKIEGVGGNNRVAYLRAEIDARGAKEALLELGSDDGLKAWLNGEVVHSKDVMRGFKEAEDKVKVGLKAGWNRLLLKVNQGGGDWSVACRVRAADGGKLEGLRMKAE